MEVRRIVVKAPFNNDITNILDIRIVRSQNNDMMEMVRIAQMEIVRTAQMKIVRTTKKGNSSIINLKVELFPFMQFELKMGNSSNCKKRK